MSLWREQYIALVIIAAMMLEAMSYADLSRQLSRLPGACKNSKRKWLPQLHFFSSA